MNNSIIYFNHIKMDINQPYSYYKNCLDLFPEYDEIIAVDYCFFSRYHKQITAVKDDYHMNLDMF